ncbi:hypothetical protein [Flammeovirga agarivorans]|uniref:Lipoprotein n=1 Tax=Flammeovirga agarivorans TaxID=2726742 RepID=A0A7X8XTY2_9BACT|nr:hypothetical protein [Flammeovirga agarivorans]NLR89719.1 hypothetical protein [Flammeovirga agarivorans]
MKYLAIIVFAFLFSSCNLLDFDSETSTFIYHQKKEDLPKVSSGSADERGEGLLYYVDYEGNIISDLYEFTDASYDLIPIVIDEEYLGQYVYRVTLVTQTWNESTNERHSLLLFQSVQLEEFNYSVETPMVIRRRFIVPNDYQVKLRSNSASFLLTERYSEDPEVHVYEVTGDLSEDHSTYLEIVNGNNNEKSYVPLFYYQREEAVFTAQDLKSSTAKLDTDKIKLTSGYNSLTGRSYFIKDDQSAELRMLFEVNETGDLIIPKIFSDVAPKLFINNYEEVSSTVYKITAYEYDINTGKVKSYSTLKEDNLVNAYSKTPKENLSYQNSQNIDTYSIWTRYKQTGSISDGTAFQLRLFVNSSDPIQGFVPIVHPDLSKLHQVNLNINDLEVEEKRIMVYESFLEQSSLLLKNFLSIDITNK